MSGAQAHPPHLQHPTGSSHCRRGGPSRSCTGEVFTFCHPRSIGRQTWLFLSQLSAPVPAGKREMLCQAGERGGSWAGWWVLWGRMGQPPGQADTAHPPCSVESGGGDGQLACSLVTAPFLSRHEGWASCQDSQPLSLSLLGKYATSSPKRSSRHWERGVCRMLGWEQPTAGCCCCRSAAGTGPVPARPPGPRQGPCCGCTGCRDASVNTSGQGRARKQSHTGAQRAPFAARLTGTCGRCRKAGPGWGKSPPRRPRL